MFVMVLSAPVLIMNIETLLYTVIGHCFCNTHAHLLRHKYGIQVYFYHVIFLKLQIWQVSNMPYHEMNVH